MSSISTVFRKDKLNKKNEGPIHFRIIKDRKVSYISSGISIPEENWDYAKNKIKSRHMNSTRLNSFLSNKFAELQDQVFEHTTISKAITNKQLKEKIYGKKPSDFFSFANGVVEEYSKIGAIGTYDRNKSIVHKLKEFAQEKELSFHDIDYDFILKYEKYLINFHKNSINTINNNFKFLRKIFNDAYRQGLIEHQVNPFLKYKLKTAKTERTYLTEEELLQIENYPATQGTRMELHRDMFVFAAYAGGLRVSDMLQIQWKHFDGTNINFTIMKTGNQLSIKVPNKGLELIEKYKPQKANKEAFIFPMLSNQLNLKDPRELDNAISSATAYINKNLKIIAGKIGLEKPISFHISRHTWATRALRKGISIDKVSKLMGHSAIRETQIYAKIVNSELDKAMDVFND